MISACPDTSAALHGRIISGYYEMAMDKNRAQMEHGILRNFAKELNNILRLFIEEFFPLADMMTFKAGQSLFLVKLTQPNAL